MSLQHNPVQYMQKHVSDAVPDGISHVDEDGIIHAQSSLFYRIVALNIDPDNGLAVPHKTGVLKYGILSAIDSGSLTNDALRNFRPDVHLHEVFLDQPSAALDLISLESLSLSKKIASNMVPVEVTDYFQDGRHLWVTNELLIVAEPYEESGFLLRVAPNPSPDISLSSLFSKESTGQNGIESQWLHPRAIWAIRNLNGVYAKDGDGETVIYPNIESVREEVAALPSRAAVNGNKHYADLSNIFRSFRTATFDENYAQGMFGWIAKRIMGLVTTDYTKEAEDRLKAAALYGRSALSLSVIKYKALAGGIDAVVESLLSRSGTVKLLEQLTGKAYARSPKAGNTSLLMPLNYDSIWKILPASLIDENQSSFVPTVVKELLQSSTAINIGTPDNPVVKLVSASGLEAVALGPRASVNNNTPAERQIYYVKDSETGTIFRFALTHGGQWTEQDTYDGELKADNEMIAMDLARPSPNAAIAQQLLSEDLELRAA